MRFSFKNGSGPEIDPCEIPQFINPASEDTQCQKKKKSVRDMTGTI